MNVNKYLKHLKKKLRWRRRWLALMVFLVGLAVWIAAYHLEVNKPALSAFAPIQDSIDTIQQLKGTQETYLQKIYVCGEETEKLGNWDSKQLLETYNKHSNWSVSFGEEGKVIFIEQVEDLSPACKEKAYFGMDESGNLSLFNGLPAKDNVIRTFFQLNIDYLKSSLPKAALKDLYEGIRISDLDEYNSVLSTFSDYAIEETEPVMHP
ncbi:BofC C-terminal domain-containing protein [Paenibacillus eucommiae]|uniref:Forespore regulator of the sigma-K checkpoint n=1 Tax=Paenibacillus eucommiae TaxID=1355755 RepID=A0ABS4JA96_9BACL|nr:BofC C-terminal domain-containing protein [Paenibacillus eucommiae]MBP1996773.1 forespore regulator of the sigma-K checkpoint [Paenibacillus eucommiae]